MRACCQVSTYREVLNTLISLRTGMPAIQPLTGSFINSLFVDYDLCSVEEEGSVLLQTWLNNMRGNSQLRVLLMAKTSATLRLVIPALEGMRLEEIDVSGCSMEPETAAVLTQQIANSDTLRALNLSGCGLSAEAVGYLLARLTSNTRLRQTQLQAGGNLITTLSPEVLSNALMSNCNLHTLDLSTTYLNEESILEFFGCLTRNSNTLDTLVLDDDFTYYISSHVSGVRTAHALADMLQQTGLKKLSLKGTSSVMPVGIKSFSADPKRVLVPLLDRLKRNDTLLELDISNNQLGNAIAVSIADVLRYNTTLVALNCDNNRITLNGWAAIAVAFRHNRTLQHFAFPVLDSQKCAAALGSEKKQQKLYALLTSIQLATNANQAAGLHPRLLAKRQQDPLSAPPAVPQPPGTAPRTVPSNLAPSSGTAAAPAEKNSTGAKKFDTSRLISPRRPTMEMPLCQRGQMPRGQSRSRAHQHLAAVEVAAALAHELAAPPRPSDLDDRAGEIVIPAEYEFGVLHGNDGIGPVRHRRSRHDADGGARGEDERHLVACGDIAGDLESDGDVRDVRCADGETVHLRVAEQRQVDLRAHVRRRDPAGGLGERNGLQVGLRGQRRQEPGDVVDVLLDAALCGHGFSIPRGAERGGGAEEGRPVSSAGGRGRPRATTRPAPRRGRFRGHRRHPGPGGRSRRARRGGR